MKAFPTSTTSFSATADASWPARIGHEIIGAAITGIFCVVGLVVAVTEFRPSKLVSRRAAEKSESSR